jgi:phytoene dehydrogenase-like protein
VSTPATSVFDVIVIGGGANGLTAAAYLAKSGLKVAVVERNDKVGTHMTTGELSTPGWKNNPHASGLWAGHSPAVLDLELERYGLNIIFPRFSRAQPFLDGKAMVPDLWDANNFYRKWLKFSKNDAKIFRDIYDRFNVIKPEIMQRWVFSPPSPENWDATVELFKSIPHIPDDFLEMTGFELVDYLFEDDHIKGWIAGWSHAVAFEPQTRLLGAMGAVLLISAFGVSQSIGGSIQLPLSLSRVILQNGGSILANCTAEKIVVEDGEATGVVLKDYSSYPHRVLKARKAIISDLSPVPTFLHLLGEEHLDKSVSRVLKGFDYDYGCLFTAAWLTKSPPAFIGSDFDPQIQEAWHFNNGADTMEEVEAMVKQLLEGKIPEPPAFLAANFIFSLFDKKSVPPGMHSVQIWSDVPYRTDKYGGPDAWDNMSEGYLDRCTDRMEEYAPGFKASIVDKMGWSPLDISRRNPSAIKGVWSGGILQPGQMYFDRPFLGCNAPRTPIKRLFLSNGVFPHSFSWLGAGYNAASAVMEDLGLRKPDWWCHKPLEWPVVWMRRNGIEPKMKITV